MDVWLSPYSPPKVWFTFRSSYDLSLVLMTIHSSNSKTILPPINRFGVVTSCVFSEKSCKDVIITYAGLGFLIAVYVIENMIYEFWFRIIVWLNLVLCPCLVVLVSKISTTRSIFWNCGSESNGGGHGKTTRNSLWSNNSF